MKAPLLQTLVETLRIWSETAAKSHAVDAKVLPERAQGRPTAPPRSLQEVLGGSRGLFSPRGFGIIELPERAPRLGNTTILVLSATSGMDARNRDSKT